MLGLWTGMLGLWTGAHLPEGPPAPEHHAVLALAVPLAHALQHPRSHLKQPCQPHPTRTVSHRHAAAACSERQRHDAHVRLKAAAIIIIVIIVVIIVIILLRFSILASPSSSSSSSSSS
eukprot:2722946-Rhodomonas_salina.1